MANRGVLRANVRTELQEATAGFWSDAELNGWLDEAHADLVMSTEQETTAALTLVGGTEAYSLPADFALARRVELQSTAGSATNWINLLPYTLDLRRPGDPLNAISLTSVPGGFYVYGGKIYFVPVPDGAYSGTLFYFKNATPFSGDSDSPSYPEGIPAPTFDRLLQLYTCAMALRKRQDSAYTTYLGDYAAGRADVIRAAGDRGSSAPLQVHDDWLSG